MTQGKPNGKPQKSSVASAVGDFLSPASFIKAARAAHPAFRYVIVAAGILAIVVTFIRFGVSSVNLVFGGVVLIWVMVVFLVFAQASRLAGASLNVPAQVLVWTCLILFIVLACGLVSSTFANQPLPFRDWIRALGTPPAAVRGAEAGPPSTPPPVSGGASIDKELMLKDLQDAYVASGRKLSFLAYWGRPPAIHTLRVRDGILTGTAPDGSTVSTSIDPKLMPKPRRYGEVLSQISGVQGKEASGVARFFSSYEQFRTALARLNSSPTDFLLAFSTTVSKGREVVGRGHEALCTMGMTPPRIYPDGGFVEPIDPHCAPPPGFTPAAPPTMRQAPLQGTSPHSPSLHAGGDTRRHAAAHADRTSPRAGSELTAAPAPSQAPGTSSTALSNPVSADPYHLDFVEVAGNYTGEWLSLASYQISRSIVHGDLVNGCQKANDSYWGPTFPLEQRVFDLDGGRAKQLAVFARAQLPDRLQWLNAYIQNKFDPEPIELISTGLDTLCKVTVKPGSSSRKRTVHDVSFDCPEPGFGYNYQGALRLVREGSRPKGP